MIALLLSSLAACTQAQRTAALAASSSALIVIDWRQTEHFTRIGIEENPIIGAHGERFPINAYFPIAVVAGLVIGALLPVRWRDIWFASVGGAELSTVVSNSLGGDK